MRHLGPWTLALALALTLGCDDDDKPSVDPTPDGAPADASDVDGAADGEAEAGLPDMASEMGPADMQPDMDPADMQPDMDPADMQPDMDPVDMQLDMDPVDMQPDMAQPDMVVPDMAPPCVAPAPVQSPPPGVLADVPLREAAVVGGPPLTGTLAAADFEGDGVLDLAVVRGGRLEAVTSDGVARWQSAVTGVNRIGGIVDLDGDARLEVVAAGPRTLQVHDALTGELVWALPDDPLGELAPDFVAVTVVFLTDLDRDGRTDLYVTDGACTADGPGFGALYRFIGGLENPQLTAVLGPRINGRCTTSQTLTDWDGDGQVDLLLNDARGLNLFDLQTGERRLCGAVPDIADGVLPHRSADLLPDVEGRELMVLREDGLRLVALEDRERPDCPGQPALRTRWRYLADTLEDALATADVDGDGQPEVIISRRDDGGGWITEALAADDGAVRASAPGWAIRGQLDTADGPALLVTDNPRRFGNLQLLRMSADGPELLWPEALPNAAFAVRAPKPTTPALGVLLAQPQIMRSEAGPRAVVLRDATEDGLIDGIQLATVAGGGPGRVMDGPPGVIEITCDPTACDTRDLLVLGEPDGRVLTLEADLTPRVDPGVVPVINTGRAQLVITDDEAASVVVRTANNRVGAVNLARPEAPFEWSLSVGTGLGSDPLPFVLPIADGPDSVVVGATRFGPNTWLALDAATGEERWRSDLPTDLIRPPEATVAMAADGARFIRLDAPADAMSFDGVPGCPEPTVVGDVLSPEPICRQRPLNPRIVSAWDAETGACLWQTHIRPVANCAGRSNQRVSAADIDGDGEDEIYLTESVALRQLDLATGAVLQTTNLLEDPGRASGGGLVVATGVPEHPIVVTGANGPIEVRGDDLSEQWSAAWPAELDPRSWLFRQVLIVGDEVWASPRGGWPLARYALDSESPAEPVGQLALLDGAAVPAAAAPEFAQINAMRRLEGLGEDGASGLVATTDEAWLYGLTEAGELAWSRRLPALAEPPLTKDLNGDGQLSLVVPLSDGRVLLGEAQVLVGPPTVYDRPCEAVPLCAPDDDLDLNVVPGTDTLCAAWVAVAEADSYEVRATTGTGTPLTGWIPVDRPETTLEGLALVPGARYRVQVRAVATVGDATVRSDVVASDGVRITDGEPPQLNLEVDPPAAPTGEPVTLRVDASDNDRVANRRLEILSAEGRLQWFADLDEVVLERWQDEYVWDGRDLDGQVAPAGAYVVRATVGDRANNRVVVDAALQRCDGPCP